MWPEFGSLPPGIVPLILIFGGLAFSIPVTVGTMLHPPTNRNAGAPPRVRSVLVDTRRPHAHALDVRTLPPLDAALELTFRAGIGDPRVMYSDAHRKLVRVHPPDGGEPDAAYRQRALHTLEEAFARVLGHAPRVKDLSMREGRCEFLVEY